MCRASQLYSLNCLRKACSEKIEQQLKTADAPSIKNAFGNLESALYLRDDALKDRCLAFIKTNFTEVMSLEALSGSQPEAVICFLRYLAKEEHDIKPVQLLRFVIPWLETRKEQELRNIILSHIDVLSMSEEEFRQILRERPLFFNQEEIGRFFLNKLNSTARNSTISLFKTYDKNFGIFFDIFLAIVIICALFITRNFIMNLKFLALSFIILMIYVLILKKPKSSIRHRNRFLSTLLMFISFSVLLHIPMNDLDSSPNNETIRNSSSRTCEQQLLELLLKFHNVTSSVQDHSENHKLKFEATLETQNVTSPPFNSSEYSQSQSAKLNTTVVQLNDLKSNTSFLDDLFYFLGLHTITISIAIKIYETCLRKWIRFNRHCDTLMNYIILTYFCLRPYGLSLILFTANVLIYCLTWIVKNDDNLDKVLISDFLLLIAYDIIKTSFMYFYDYSCLMNLLSCLILTLIIYLYFSYFSILKINFTINTEVFVTYLAIVHLLNYVYYFYQNAI